jgi:hypothetical protein
MNFEVTDYKLFREKCPPEFKKEFPQLHLLNRRVANDFFHCIDGETQRAVDYFASFGVAVTN